MSTAIAFVSCIIGLVITSNPYLPALDQHVRWIDVLSLLSIPLILLYIPSSLRLHWILPGAIVIVVLELPWLWTDFRTHGLFDGSLSFRWAELTALAVSLEVIHGYRRCREAFALGMFLGGPANCLLLWLQSRGFSDELTRIGLAYPNVERVFAVGTAMERFSGLHGHPNAAAAVIGLCIPAAIALNVEFKKSWLFVGGAIVVCVVGAWLTYSRTPFIVSGVLLVSWLFKLSFKDKRVLIGGLVLIGTGLVAGSAIPSLNSRWTEDESASTNAAIRLDTTIRSAELAMNAPLGLGSDFEDEMPLDLLATHNAFTHLALSGGIALALLVFTCLLASAIRLRQNPGLNEWLALYLLGIFFFEEHLRNPTFIVLVLWLMLSTLQRLTMRVAVSAVKRRTVLSSPGFSTLSPASRKGWTVRH